MFLKQLDEMRRLGYTISVLLIWMFFLLISNSGYAQTIIKGVIKDASSNMPLSFVSVYFKGSKGVVSGEDGMYTISTTNKSNTGLVFSFAGYKAQTVQIALGISQEINVFLEPVAMKEVVVKSKTRGKYTNKNNPAVDLIRKVVEHRNENRVSSYDYVQYQQYEKLQLSLSNKPEKLLNNALLKNYKFLLENKDTTKVEGKALLPVYLKEVLSEKYYRKHPEKIKTYILAEKKVDLGDFVDNDGFTSYLNSLYTNIDIYESNIGILSNKVLSPISDLAPTFYRFYIRDTIEAEGTKLIELYFSPRNLNDLLFKGTMYVTLDSQYAVQKITLGFSRNANINWTRELKIQQEFERGDDKKYRLTKSYMLTDFALTKTAKGGITGERTVSFKDYIINQPAADTVYVGKPEEYIAGVEASTDSFWVTHRHTPLSVSENSVYENMDSLVNMKSFKRMMDWMTLLLAGYKSAGPIDIGPVNTFYSFNPVEGFRLRVGGRTTPKFSKRIYFENYVAYGFKDEQWKYFLSATYSLNKKSVYSYPLNFVRVSYQYDTKIPGQELQFVQEDNFLLSFKRGDNNKWLYNNIFQTDYVREFGKNITTTLSFKNWKQQTAGNIVYEKKDAANNISIPHITTSEISAELRWAPNEQFYQSKTYRIPIYNKYPVFNLRYTAGFKGLMNGEYNYQIVSLRVFKRFYLSQFGYADVTSEGGYIFGKLPYPLLMIHRANQTYAYQLNSYNLMNFMEFVSDHYASVSSDYYFNGLLLNRIPLIKKLKLREVAGVKVLFGAVRKENNPDYNNDAFIFPKNDKGETTTFSLKQRPYIEANIGIGNIFKIARVDLVKRLTYLDNPDAPSWGIRARFKFDF